MKSQLYGHQHGHEAGWSLRDLGLRALPLIRIEASEHVFHFRRLMNYWVAFLM